MLEDDARAELERLDGAGLLRGRRVVTGRQGVRVTIDGREVINFSANDYLGLAGHPALEAAAAEALRRTGVGAGASRLIVGNSSDHERLESAIGSWLERKAVLFNAGYAANTGVIPVLAGRGDVVLSDELNHASIIDGCRLSRAEVVVYRHLDLADLERKLGEQRGRRVVVVTETLFSMDGDAARARR
jgi:8-amino-7-oxononanoate synthase